MAGTFVEIYGVFQRTGTCAVANSTFYRFGSFVKSIAVINHLAHFRQG